MLRPLRPVKTPVSTPSWNFPGRTPRLGPVVRWVGVGLTLGLGLVATGCWWWVGRPERHLAAAETAFEAEEWDQALVWLTVPRREPQTRERASLLRAQIALRRGRPSEAVGPLDEVDPNGPQALAAAFWKGRTLLAVGQTERGLAWFRGYVAQRGDDPEGWRWLAVAAYDLGSRDEAITALNEVTRLRPDDAPAWRTLGLVHREQVDHDLAIQAYERALKADPGQPGVRLELAASLVEAGRFTEAEAQLERCRGQVPEADRAVLRARCRAALGDVEAQRAILDEALARSPGHPDLLADRAVLDLANRDLDAAIARLDRALKAAPFDPKLHHRRSLAHHAAGHDAEAARDQARANALNQDLARMSELNEQAAQHPTEPEVRHQIGELCERLGKPKLAETWFRAALACDPRHEPANKALRRLAAGRR